MNIAPDRRLGWAALAACLAFCVHAANGLVIERFVLDFTSYSDYSNAQKLDRAIGSLPWTMSGAGHLVTGFAMVFIALALSQWFAAAGSSSAPLIQAVGLISATGFLLNGIASLLGAQVLAQLQTNSPDQRLDVVVAFGLFVPIVNGLAIVMLGWLALIVARASQQNGLLPRWFWILSYVAGVSGVIFAVAYIPVYLFLDLAWFACLAAIVLRATSRQEASVS